jgi:hypothetical protein
MDRSDKYKWTIIYSDHNNKFIHLDYLTRSNPDSQILLADISNNYDPKFCWRNGDFLIRQWLQKYIDIVHHNNIALLEWDVLVSQTLPSIQVDGLIGKNVKYRDKNPKWPWFKEIDRLDNYSQYSIGVAPLGVLFLNKECLEILLDSEFDDLYQKDIFSELRLPTILNSRNIKISSYFLPDVEWYQMPVKTNPGIYHSVKTKQ